MTNQPHAYFMAALLAALLCHSAAASEPERKRVGRPDAQTETRQRELMRRANAVRLGTFEARTFRGLPYRLFRPRGYDETKRYPLILFFHGVKGRGRDNRRNVMGGNKIGTRIWTLAENQAKHPCFVVAPQCPTGDTWGSTARTPTPTMAKVVALLDALQREFSVDDKRLYVTGLSMGGRGTWDIIARYPDRFAAAVPICGRAHLVTARRLTGLPIWIFHGDADRTVPVDCSRKMYEALVAAGSKRVRYWELTGVGHGSWTRAYTEPTLIGWLFSQKRP